MSRHPDEGNFISVLIPTKNELANIADCIASVRWANEILVVDSRSNDGTPDVARGLGATVVDFTYEPGGLKKKNWALSNVPFRGAWVLIVDADERITPELALEIQSAVLRAERNVSGFYINRRFFFMGRWIQHAGYYPSWNLRLFRLGHGHYERIEDHDSGSGDNEVHEHVILTGKAAYLKEPMDHFAYPSISVFVEKHNRYSNWEAKVGAAVSKPIEGMDLQSSQIGKALDRKRSLKRFARMVGGSHWLRFLYHYVARLGFLDGVEGYIFCHLLAEYEFLIWAKTRELCGTASPTGS